jgi:hypothetical protein
MKTYKQTSEKFGVRNIEELAEKINSLGAAVDMPMSVKLTIPEVTDTKYWYIVNYFSSL